MPELGGSAPVPVFFKLPHKEDIVLVETGKLQSLTLLSPRRVHGNFLHGQEVFFLGHCGRKNVVELVQEATSLKAKDMADADVGQHIGRCIYLYLDPSPFVQDL
jgi:hypothetical protein